MRWLVGDVQGCARELEALVTKMNFDPARDEIYLLGDIINRGPETIATLELWEQLGGKGVIGNHEVYGLCVASGAWPRKPDTLDELFASTESDRWLGKLRALPALLHLDGHDGGPGTVLVHAGLHPAWSDLPAMAASLNEGQHDDAWLQSDDVSFATRVRCCTADGQRTRFAGKPEDAPTPFQPWDEHYRGDALVAHGHWAWRGFHRSGNVIGLDSACVYGGELSAYCIEEDRVLSVPAAKRYA